MQNVKCKIFYSAFCILNSTFLFTSCEVINPAEPVPSYLHIDAFTVYSSAEAQGSHSSSISDVWVSVDGQALGAYELPATVPVLEAGNHEVILSAGILMNGIAATRIAYPFYASFDTTMNLESGKTVTVRPSVTYASFANFQIEDFDHSSISIDTTPASTSVLIDTTDANALEGDFGYVHLDESHQNFDCASITSFSLPGGGANVYAEINYKCSSEFTFGLIANTTTSVYQNDIITIRATDTWKKIYVNLTPTVSPITNATGWKMYLHGTRADGQSTADFYFDNIKVVY